VAGHARPVPDLGFRGDAPADHGRRSARPVREVPRALSESRGARARAGRERSRGVVGPRLLRPGAQPARRRPRDRGPARRARPVRRRHPPRAARLRRVHRGRRGFDRVRGPPSGRRRERDPCALATPRHRGRGRNPPAPRRRLPARGSPPAAKGAGRSHGRADGPRAADLHAAQPRLPRLSALPPLRGARGGSAGALSPAPREAGAPPRLRRRRGRGRTREGPARAVEGRAAPRVMALPIGASRLSRVGALRPEKNGQTPRCVGRPGRADRGDASHDRPSPPGNLRLFGELRPSPLAARRSSHSHRALAHTRAASRGGDPDPHAKGRGASFRAVRTGWLYRPS
jgi:hypothetical protein